MKRLSICLSLLLVLTLVIGGAISCTPEDKEPVEEGPAEEGPAEEEREPVVLKFALATPPGDFLVVKSEEMAARFNERAADYKYSIEIYSGGTLCTFEESLDMVKAGAVEMANFGLEYAAAEDERFLAVGLPFMLDDLEANVRFVELIGDSLYNGIFEEKFNQRPVSRTISNFHEYCGNLPIETLEDWEGLLIQTSNPMEAATVEALGASSVGMPFFDLVPSMEKGVVDGGVGAGPIAIYFLNWYDSFKCITTASNMFGLYSVVNINLDVFNAMPSEVQEILLDEGKRWEDEVTQGFLDGYLEGVAACEENGIEVYYLPEAERDRWAEASRSVVDDYFVSLDPEDAEKIQDAFDEANQ
jgi:TRAP-type C4-dicarboxylate transport system substrate-binding protein